MPPAQVSAGIVRTTKGWLFRQTRSWTPSSKRLEDGVNHVDYKDYYKVLGVGRDADADQIKRKYRKLARKHHPDVNNDQGAEARFKEISEAYQVLKDPEKRKAYDQFGADWASGQKQQQYKEQYRHHYQPPGGEAGGGFDFASHGEGDHSEFFESLFGGGGQFWGRGAGGPRSRKGEDLNASITIPLETAFHGATQSMSFEMPRSAPDGTTAYAPVHLNVKIPKGIKSGQKIRLAGQGGPGMHDGVQGDFYIAVKFKTHPLYRVDGADVYIKLPVAPWEAALGASVRVPTPGGAKKVRIPPDSAQGRKLRLKGAGIPAKTPGDLYVIVTLVLPPATDKKAAGLYEQMKELNFDPRAGLE
jgi:curved DNA-binding protein